MLWATIFNSTIAGSKWFKEVGISPGRAAVGYPFFYVLYRILDEVKPNDILEMGLGQSTKMIGQYANYCKCDHYIVEDNLAWISFFRKGFSLSENTKFIVLETKMESYKNAEAVRVFGEFEGNCSGKKYDLICIDAPLGYDMPTYSRIDILKILPDCLKKSFAIIIDDYQRIGERNTVQDIKNILDANAIKYVTGIYSGDKELCIICSIDNEFHAHYKHKNSVSYSFLLILKEILFLNHKNILFPFWLIPLKDVN